MLIFYQLSIWSYAFVIRIISSFHHKARKFSQGRKNWKTHLMDALKDNSAEVIWFHAASLGEFEQGRPVIEELKKKRKGTKILLTFFSPSGYEIRKTYEHADWVFYLPIDNASNAKFFMDTVKPSLAVFIKYEFWYYFLKALYKRQIPVLMISCIFRENQLFFHPLGKFYHSVLKNITYYFVQDEKSKRLIGGIGISNTSVAGDTRFDRVISIAKEAKQMEIIERFKGDSRLMVLGSTWPSDIEKLIPFIESYKGKMKFVVAPHNIGDRDIEKLETQLGNSVRYSKSKEENLNLFNVLIIDNMGMLSSLYRYGEFAFIGGGFRGSLHNTLEAAVYGIPVCFGEHPNNQKFMEAIELVENGGAFTFTSSEELDIRFKRIFENEVSYRRYCQASNDFVLSRSGATTKVMEKILELLP